MIKSKFILGFFLISSIATAQVVNLSGSWNLNSSKSKLNAEFSFAPKQIILTQKGIELAIEKHYLYQDQDYKVSEKLTLDNNECTNTWFRETQKKSTAAWSEDKKTILVNSKVSTDNNEITIKEVYKMEGNNMVLESSASSPDGSISETFFYEKQ